MNMKRNGDCILMSEDNAVEFAVKHLDAQILSGADGEEFEDRILDLYSMGYLFGFSCGAVAATGVRDFEKKLFLLRRIYAGLFVETGLPILDESLGLQGERAFQKGGHCGWLEAGEALNTKAPALGLVSFLIAQGIPGNVTDA